MSEGADRVLESLITVFKRAGGPRAAVGMLIGLLRTTTAEQCAEKIKNNQPLLGNVSDEDWQTYGRHAEGVNLDKITMEMITTRLQERRPDLFKVINTPEGLAWLQNQVESIKAKLRQVSQPQPMEWVKRE